MTNSVGGLFEQKTASSNIRLSAGTVSALLFCLSLFVYLPLLFSTDFIWDDFVLLRSNVLGRPGALATIWLSPGSLAGEEHYWPMTYTVFHLQRLLWGTDVVGHHFVNLLLHGLNTSLLYCVARAALLPSPWLIAALFAIHPVHVESVAWVIELKDVLSGLFYLLSAGCYLLLIQKGQPRWGVAAILLYIAGLLSKSIVVTLPVALFLLLWYSARLNIRRDSRWLGAMMLTGIVLTVADLILVGAANSTPFELTAAQRLSLVIINAWFYLYKAFVPVNLTLIYPKWNIGFTPWTTLMGALLLGLAILLLTRRNRWRGTAAGFAYFALTLSPVLGLIKFSFMQFSFAADRFQYLASIGPICIMAGLFHQLKQHVKLKFLVIPVFTAMLLWWSVTTLLYAYRYTSEEKLFRHNLRHNPQSEVAHSRLGIIMAGRQEFAEALLHFEKVAQLSPASAGAHFNIAFTAQKAGDIPKARAAAKRALELDPAHKRAGQILKELNTLPVQQQ